MSRKSCHPFQYVPCGNVEEHERSGLGLARLEQGEELEGLVEGAEPTGEHGVAVGLLDEHELAGEEVPHLHELGVLRDELVGALLVGEPDVDPEGALPTRTLHPGRHDAGAGAGHHHPSVARHALGQASRLEVERVVGQGAGRAEEGDLLLFAKGPEHAERLGHLGHRGAGQLQVEGVGAFLGQVDDGPDDRAVEVASSR